jgi:hypothetical protein
MGEENSKPKPNVHQHRERERVSNGNSRSPVTIPNDLEWLLGAPSMLWRKIAERLMSGGHSRRSGIVNYYWNFPLT